MPITSTLYMYTCVFALLVAFVFALLCMYIYVFELSHQLERTNIGNAYVQSTGTCIYLYAYVVMKL